MVSSGKAILNSLADLRGDSIEVLAVVCVIDRETGGREALASPETEVNLTPPFYERWQRIRTLLLDNRP